MRRSPPPVLGGGGADERSLSLRERISHTALQHLYNRLEIVRDFEEFTIEAIARVKTLQS